MYTQIWNKYLPVIRILIKRAVDEDQTFQLNISDFEKSGPPRKTGFKFSIHFRNGRVDNTSSLPPIGKDLAAVLLQNPTVNELFMQNEYNVNMSSKFQLDIQCITKVAQEAVSVEANEAAE
jgi:hypothetical protein